MFKTHSLFLTFFRSFLIPHFFRSFLIPYFACDVIFLVESIVPALSHIPPFTNDEISTQEK